MADSTITRDYFPNYAGVKDIDDALAAELQAAGIEVHRFRFLKNGKSEVDTEVVGDLHGWSFRRAWYYWRAEGPEHKARNPGFTDYRPARDLPSRSRPPRTRTR